MANPKYACNCECGCSELHDSVFGKCEDCENGNHEHDEDFDAEEADD